MKQTFYTRTGKRLFDVTVSALGLAVSAPVLGMIGVVSAITQGRPVLYSQQRIGRNGEPFTLWKFRSMTNRPQTGSTVTTRGDARITPLGATLRRYKLDELPQLWCVLRGDMSLVGPRPDVAGYWDEVAAEDQDLLALRPGITGPGSLLFRNEEEILAEAEDPEAFNDEVLFPEKIRLTRQYAQTLSLMGDLRWGIYTVLPFRWVRPRLKATGWRLAPHAESPAALPERSASPSRAPGDAV